jgi:hypothetical protein
MDMETIAEYAFMVFVVLAIIMGIVVGAMGWIGTETDSYLMLVMLILGVIVGLVSVTAKEVTPFLIACIALVVVGVSADVWQPLATISSLLSDIATAILRYIVGFAAPAAVLIAIKSFWAIGREK